MMITTDLICHLCGGNVEITTTEPCNDYPMNAVYAWRGDATCKNCGHHLYTEKQYKTSEEAALVVHDKWTHQFNKCRLAILRMEQNETEKVKWTGKNHSEVLDFLCRGMVNVTTNDGILRVPLTTNYTLKVNTGDYIIKGIGGFFYTCKEEEMQNFMRENK